MSLKSSLRKLIPSSLLNLYHFCWSFLGAVLYGFPGQTKTMKIVGVTGTSGKSTTTDFICRILDEAGYKVASISSIRFKVGDKEWQNEYKMTMPGRLVIQKFLSQAKKAKCDFVVLEVTSEGLRQSRHAFIDFDTAVFTNLSREHIESHGSFEKYRAEKIKLFNAASHIHVINEDDQNAKYFSETPAKEKIFFSGNDAKLISKDRGLAFDYKGTAFSLNMEGAFNIENALAAISVAQAYHVDLEICREALEKVKGISGRMEVVSENPKVVVDYAHTPDQLEKVYRSFPDKKLVCVLGSCGGGRDVWKRPVLGEIAQKYCDRIFITNEDPYDEDPMSIINQVAEKAGDKAEKILDRKEAIQKAVSGAKVDEAVIITGKGSEVWMVVANGKKIPWSDAEIAKASLPKAQ